MSKSRQYTNQLLELAEGGGVDLVKLIQDLLGFMSEADVEEFATSNGYIEEIEEEDEDEE